MDTFGMQLVKEADIPADEKWGIIRATRSVLLSRCDWTQLPDAPLALTEKQAWATYRQVLRDIPEAFTAPEEVEFPEAPDPDVVNNIAQPGSEL